MQRGSSRLNFIPAEREIHWYARIIFTSTVLAVAKASCSSLKFSLCFLRQLCQQSQRNFVAPNLSSLKEKALSTVALAFRMVSTFCNVKYKSVNHLRKQSTNMSRSWQACTLRCSCNKLLQATCTNTNVAIRDVKVNVIQDQHRAGGSTIVQHNACQDLL